MYTASMVSEWLARPRRDGIVFEVSRGFDQGKKKKRGSRRGS